MLNFKLSIQNQLKCVKKAKISATGLDNVKKKKRFEVLT